MDHVLSDPQKRRLYRIAWTAVCLLWGGGFSLAVSAPDTVLGMIIVFAMAFGGFAWAAMDWSSGISKVLAKIGITTFAMRAAATVCLISFTILALNFVGSLAARSSTPETQLRTSVSGTSAPPVPNQNNASDASKRDVTKGVSGASAGCHPPVFSQQELSAFEQQATSGDAAAQCGLGMMYIKGQGVPQDDTQAVAWFRMAAEQGNAHGQYNLGVSYYHGQGVPQDYAQAAFWFRKAAEQGDADGQCDLGVSYGNGEGVPQDYAQAALWFRMAAEQGNAHAQYNLGAWYEEGEDQGVPQDDTQAAFWRRKIRAWRAYINSVDFHNSEHWRYTQAAFWYRKAADQGDADAQDALGVLYDDGRGVPQDYAEAAFWYRKAADQGDADAQDALGVLYDDGRGVPQDYAEAALWYRKAAEQGNSSAEFILGYLYLDGHGVPQDATEAAAWFRKAAEQGDAAAQTSLGLMYAKGQGVPRDYAEAYFWYDLVAAGKQDATDSKQVAKDRDEAASHLTAADLFRAQERAAKWFEAHQAKPQRWKRR